MTEKESFLSYLKVLQRKLQVRYLLVRTIYGILLSLGIAFLTLLFGRIVAVPHLLEFACIGAGAVFLIYFISVWFKKSTLGEAARYFNRFVGEDRVETALGYLHDDSNKMIAIQRNDTLQRMRRAMPEIHQMKLFVVNKKYVASVVATSVVVILMAAFPNDVMKQGKLIEKENELVKKAKKEVEELSKEKGALTAKEKKELKEQIDEVKSPQELLQTLLKKEKELNDVSKEAEKKREQLMTLSEKSESLNGLSEALHKLDQKKLQEAMEDLKEQKLSEKQQETLMNLDKELNGSTNSNELSEEELNQLLDRLQKSLEDAVTSAAQLDDLKALQSGLQSSAQSLNTSMQASGMSGVQSLSFSNSNSSSSSSSQSSTVSNRNSSQGQGAGKGGQGTGAGKSGTSTNGSGNGSGNGNGTGNGGGSGSAGGKGGSSGGSGQGSRDLLTVPNRLGAKGDIEQDSGDLGQGKSEMEEAPESPVLPGSVRSYQEVYGDYSEGYRQSVERLQLPNHLESLVKQYYSEMNPEGE